MRNKTLKMKYSITLTLIILLALGCSQTRNKTDKKEAKRFNAAEWTDEQLLDSVQYHTFQYF